MNHQPTDLKPAEFNRTVYQHAVAVGNDYEKDVLSPAYWVHVCNKLKDGDRIEVTAKDGTYFAELYVASVSPIGARVVELSKAVLKANVKEVSALDDPDYLLKLRGPQKWSIIRKADGVVIKDMLPTRSDAEKELTEYRKAVAA